MSVFHSVLSVEERVLALAVFAHDLDVRMIGLFAWLAVLDDVRTRADALEPVVAMVVVSGTSRVHMRATALAGAVGVVGAAMAAVVTVRRLRQRLVLGRHRHRALPLGARGAPGRHRG